MKRIDTEIRPVNNEARKLLSPTVTSIDYSDPNYADAIRIIDNLRGHGFMKNRPDQLEAVKLAMDCMKKRDVVITEKTLSKEVLEIKHKELAMKNARMAMEKDSRKFARTKWEMNRADQIAEDRAFKDAARKLLDVMDFMAIVEMAKELIAARRLEQAQSNIYENK